jgi:hypothetical protein
MGTHCLAEEFHPEFHVEVIGRPYTCVLAQLVPYDVILLQHGWFVVEPRHFLRNRVHQIGDRSCFFTHYSFLRFCTWPWLAKYSLEDYVKKTNRKRFYINDF